jgi:hypothetical protein
MAREAQAQIGKLSSITSTILLLEQQNQQQSTSLSSAVEAQNVEKQGH